MGRPSRTFDARNRISTLAFPDANGNQGWSYTADGLPASVITYNDGGTTTVVNTYTYNKRRLMTAETSAQPGWYTWPVGHSYDASGHLASQSYPDGYVINYAPNALGQPTQAGTFATGVTYWPNGAIKQFTYGNGIVHSLAQNARGLPDRSKDLDGVTSIHEDSYTYDRNGNVATIVDGVPGNRGNRSMTYDALNRLTDVASPMYGTIGAHYTYDVLDNITSVTAPSTAADGSHLYCYDASNRLTDVKVGSCGGATVVDLGYDVQGNLANKNGVAYGFDYGNRLRGVTGLEGYRYDANGRRVLAWSPTLGSILSVYARSGQLAFQQNQRNQNTNLDYIYLGGSLVATRAQAVGTGVVTVTYQHTDALGSPVATTNSAKAVLQRSEYEPYGYLLNRPMQDGPGYTGHVTDAATGLVYMQQRYYDPVLSEFPSTDPVTPFSADGAFNRYWYANANPYRMADPDGRSPNEVYLISGGGEWKSGQTISARKGANSNSSQTDESSSSWPSLPQGLVNGVAAFGDGLTWGGTKWYREWREIGSVDYGSDMYIAGEVTGVAYGFALGGAGGLNGGARSVFWSGEANMERAAAMGRSLERTPIGALMNRFGSRLPHGAWKAASCIYACNASGTAIKVGLQEGAIWGAVERPILQWRGVPFNVVP